MDTACYSFGSLSDEGGAGARSEGLAQLQGFSVEEPWAWSPEPCVTLKVKDEEAALALMAQGGGRGAPCSDGAGGRWEGALCSDGAGGQWGERLGALMVQGGGRGALCSDGAGGRRGASVL